jgi:putative intracellular protease/amidase
VTSVCHPAGISFLVHKGFAEARTYDAIWVPGGDPAALAAMIDDPGRTYLDFLIEQASRTPMMCSVCNGAMLLPAAGLLGRKAERQKTSSAEAGLVKGSRGTKPRR